MKTIEEKLELIIKYGGINTSYGYKMGGETRLNIFKGKQIFFSQEFDNREYYSGRGAKYNKTIKHGFIEQNMKIAEFNALYKKALAWYKEEISNQKAENKIAKLLAKDDFATLEQFLLNSLSLVNDEYANDQNGRYWLNAYHGCGVYRLFFVDGKIVASLQGGYGQTLPNGYNYQKWIEFVNQYLVNIFGSKIQNAKADGSGTYFYLRDELESVETKNYFVPDARGGSHYNIEVI